MTKSNQSLLETDKKHYLQTFKRFPVVFEKGQGSRLWDVEGNAYIDALAGIAVNCLGHCHPAVTKAIQEQAAKLIHISNFYLSEPQALLAQTLCELSGLERVFFTNSGAESTEGAIKIARKYAHSKGRGGTIISMQNCFHGRTLGTIATGKKAMQKGFDPIPQGFKQVPFNDMEAIREVADKETAAVILEPIQGEGGIHVADKSFLQDLKTFCAEQDIVLIFDEIQCGMGRTGKWFAKDLFGVQPDIMALAKGLGGGVPIGAILSTEKVSAAMEYGDHGTTFGGNPLVCAASLAVINTIKEEKLLEEVTRKGAWLKRKLAELEEPSIQEIRGEGLMIGVEFDFDTKPLALEMFNNNVLANATAGNVLRLVPPFIISYEELEQVLHVLSASLKTIREHV